MSKWVPTTDPVEIRRLGKLMEELGELTQIAARCLIQGLGGIDPDTERVNRVALTYEIADVYAQLDETITRFNLRRDVIEEHCRAKRLYMQEWEL